MAAKDNSVKKSPQKLEEYIPCHKTALAKHIVQIHFGNSIPLALFWLEYQEKLLANHGDDKLLKRLDNNLLFSSPTEIKEIKTLLHTLSEDKAAKPMENEAPVHRQNS